MSYLFKTLYLSLILIFPAAHGWSGPPDICPKPKVEKSFVIEGQESSSGDDEFVDYDRDLKDVGTKIVTEKFFATKATLFNFVKLSYSTIEKALDYYKKKLGLEDLSIFLIFKGGNVLRMIAKEVLDLLPGDARKLLEDEYADYFKRSDVDFSVYVDDSKIESKGLNYEEQFARITDLVSDALNKIRDEVQKNPDQYLDFLKLDKKTAQKELNSYFEQLKDLPAVADENNPNWYETKFLQLQFRDVNAQPSPQCPFVGQHDFNIVKENGKIVGEMVGEEPHWIVRTDNRTIENTMDVDPPNPPKIVKFSLPRLKIAFKHIFTKNNDVKEKYIGGEFLDVSLEHRLSSALLDFLKKYKQNVADYTLVSEETKDQITLKAYSPYYLTQDLLTILFGDISRPWDAPKYEKRLYRLFFLYIAEMLAHYDSEELTAHFDDVSKNILDPLDKFYPLKDASEIKAAIANLVKKYPRLAGAKEVWQSFTDFVDRLAKKTADNDQEKLKEFLAIVRKNVEIAKKLGEFTFEKIDLRKIYDVEIENLF